MPLLLPTTTNVHPFLLPPQVRLWDLRANGCQALLQAPGLPTTAFDEQVCEACRRWGDALP